MGTQEKEIMTISDLAELTGWSKAYIYKKTSDNTLKFSKPLGKTIFFSREWIEKFLMSKPNTTGQEQEIKSATHVTLKK